MPVTTSGDYKLPGRFSQRFRNGVLWLIRWLPKPMGEWFLKHHGYYQVFDHAPKDSPGSSIDKWNALQLPADLTGKSVIDIGCAEGFFCLEAARSGATIIFGVDSRLNSLICARLLALKQSCAISGR